MKRLYGILYGTIKKKPVVDRNAMYLQALDGGQNMVNIKVFIMCKMIKFAYKLIHSNNENWNIIGRYWTKSFDQRYGTDFFLIQCSSLKNLKSRNIFFF